MSAAVSTLVPRAPPRSTSSGFVRAVSRSALAAATESSGDERQGGRADEQLLQPVEPGPLGGEPGQGVLVHLVLGTALAQRATQRGEGSHLQAAVLRHEDGLGVAQLRRDLVDDRDLLSTGVLHLDAHLLSHVSW